MRKYIRHPADIPIEIQTQSLGDAATESLVNISLGGLSIQSRELQAVGSIIKLSIKHVDPVFETVAKVVWCSANDKGYELGVKLLDVDDAYRARMVEQVCHIEHYKRQVLADEGRELDGQQAAMEWIKKYAHSFPKIHEDEAI